MSDDFEFLSVSNRIHQQKKEKKNLSISALIALEIPPSFICCLHDMLLLVKVIHPMYYKHLKKRCSLKPFGHTKNGLVSGRLACTLSKTEILSKIGI
jgi:hypothetical protein